MLAAASDSKPVVAALHDLASGPLGMLACVAIGAGGLLALVLATKGARVARRASALRTAVLVGACALMGGAVTWASGSISTHESHRGWLADEDAEVDRGGVPGYFALQTQKFDWV